MAEIVSRVTECRPIAGTDRIHVTLTGEAGPYSFELTPAAVADMMPTFISQPSEPGKDTIVANAISPTACIPFESIQGLCGLAFTLGERRMYVAIPPAGIDQMRLALNAVEAAYKQQKKPQ
ncbi:MAG: hypothetical protein ACM3X5_05115 [Bacillota bacterium]